MSTEQVMSGAIGRGLCLGDFEVLDVGQIVDYCTTYNNSMCDDEVDYMLACQDDFDNF